MFEITKSHNCSDSRFETTNVWTSCRTAAGESACSSWITVSIGSKCTRSLYFMIPSIGGIADRNDNCINFLELNKFGMARFGVDQRSADVGAAPGGDNGAVAARYLEQAQRLDFQAGVE